MRRPIRSQWRQVPNRSRPNTYRRYGTMTPIRQHPVRVLSFPVTTLVQTRCHCPASSHRKLQCTTPLDQDYLYLDEGYPVHPHRATLVPGRCLGLSRGICVNKYRSLRCSFSLHQNPLHFSDQLLAIRNPSARSKELVLLAFRHRCGQGTQDPRS